MPIPANVTLPVTGSVISTALPVIFGPGVQERVAVVPEHDTWRLVGGLTFAQLVVTGDDMGPSVPLLLTALARQVYDVLGLLE